MTLVRATAISMAVLRDGKVAEFPEYGFIRIRLGRLTLIIPTSNGQLGFTSDCVKLYILGQVSPLFNLREFIFRAIVNTTLREREKGVRK